MASRDKRVQLLALDALDLLYEYEGAKREILACCVAGRAITGKIICRHVHRVAMVVHAVAGRVFEVVTISLPNQPRARLVVEHERALEADLVLDTGVCNYQVASYALNN